jgi:hypothetical protein
MEEFMEGDWLDDLILLIDEAVDQIQTAKWEMERWNFEGEYFSSDEGKAKLLKIKGQCEELSKVLKRSIELSSSIYIDNKPNNST